VALAMQPLRRYPGSFLAVQFFACSALASIVLATVGITTGEWLGAISIAWLKPGVRLFSPEYLLFLVTSLTFLGGGVLALTRRYWRGVELCGVGFFIAWFSIAVLAPAASTDSNSSAEFSQGLVFFGLPGFLFIRRARRMRRAAATDVFHSPVPAR
jgi:hypothetical protein